MACCLTSTKQEENDFLLVTHPSVKLGSGIATFQRDKTIKKFYFLEMFAYRYKTIQNSKLQNPDASNSMIMLEHNCMSKLNYKPQTLEKPQFNISL